MGNVTSLNTGFIVLEHDLFQQSVEIATGYILPDALARTPKLTLQPVISCLSLPLSDAYIETNDNKTNPPPATLGPTGEFFAPLTELHLDWELTPQQALPLAIRPPLGPVVTPASLVLPPPFTLFRTWSPLAFSA